MADVASALAAAQAAADECAAAGLSRAKWDAVVAALTDAPVVVPQIFSLPLNPSNIVCDFVQYGSSRYERYQKALILTATTVNLRFHGMNQAAGGAAAAFTYPRYEWEVDGVVRASYTRVATESSGYLTGALGNEVDGLHAFDIFGVAADGSRKMLMRHYGYIDRNGQAKNDDRVALQTGSRDWEVLASSGLPVNYQAVVMPVALAQTTRVKPLTPRLGKPFTTAVPYSQLTKINLVPPSRNGWTPKYPISATKSGIRVSEQRMPYAKSDTYIPYPVLPLLDGPRGIATANMPLHLRAGRNGKCYGGDPWSFWVVDATGYKRTLCGLRHKNPPPYWDEQTAKSYDVEIVGDWDASIPVNERFPFEAWGMCWITDTLAIDPNSPLVTDAVQTTPAHTHLEVAPTTGPIALLTDAHGYILEVMFDGKAHATPAKVRRVIKGADPWGVAYWKGVVYVAERMRDRISMWSWPGYQYLGNFVGTDFLGIGSVNNVREWRGAAPATTRIYDCVGPEAVDIVVLGGIPYLYWGSLAQAEVRRKRLDGQGGIEVVCRPLIDNNSGFLINRVSPEGTFGPGGTVFTTTWAGTNNGRPQAFLPVPGKAADGTPLTNSVAWKWNDDVDGTKNGRAIDQGPGGLYVSASYASAVGPGYLGDGTPENPTYGALFCSSADNGIEMFVLTDPVLDGPIPDYARALRGLDVYKSKHRILHGPECAGPDIPLPWGGDPDCDYYMETVCGQSK